MLIRDNSRRHSPTPLFAVDGPFGIVLAVLQVGLQLVQPQRGRAPKASVVTADLELGQHVAHDAGHGAEVSEGHDGAVHRADLLLGKPLSDTRITECMFTVWGLKNAGKGETRSTERRTDTPNVDLPARVLQVLHYIWDTAGLHPPLPGTS